MSEMVKYKGSDLLKRPKSGSVFHHLWHSPYKISIMMPDSANVIEDRLVPRRQYSFFPRN